MQLRRLLDEPHLSPDLSDLLQRDYWYAIAESISAWFVREIFIEQTLINLVTVAASFLLSWLIARSFKPLVLKFIGDRDLKQTAL